MFATQSYNGEGMKAKTLCLTYDDGPGPWTKEIAEFLHAHGVRATFFVLGKFARERKALLEILRDCKHIVGNHTFDHPDIPYYCSVDGNLQDQLMRTNEIIRDYVSTDRIYFRAPYGKWSAEAAKMLNMNILSSAGFTGPIHWEIPGIDCHYWKIGKTVDEAVAAYLKEIEEKQSGIIVMHDEIGDNDTIRPLYKTLELTKILIPLLLAKGYTFVGLDEIESIQNSELNQDWFQIRNRKGKSICEQNGHVSLKTVSNGTNEALWKIEMKPLGKVALRSKSGAYLHVNPSVNQVVNVIAEGPGAYEQFDFVPVREDAFMLRSDNGNFFVCNPAENTLEASGPFMRQAEVFEFLPYLVEKKKRLTFAKKMDLIKKRLLFIKSKLLQA